MATKKPTHAQAQLHMQLYDLRREPVLRLAREWFTANFFPSSGEDTVRIAPPGSRENAFVRMMMSYWDQACLLVEYGLLHEELFFRTTGEFYLVWTRMQPIIADTRKMFKNPHMGENLENVAKRYEKWASRRAPGSLEAAREYLSRFRKEQAAAGRSGG